MPFRVIDPRTGAEPVYDGNHIGREKWFKESGLRIYSLDDWVITEYGSLALTDCIGGIGYPPPGRYEIRWEANEGEEKKMYTAHEVAEILAQIFNDECACDFNRNDEWLPGYCEFSDTCCPNPGGVACWEQWLKWRGRKEEGDA